MYAIQKACSSVHYSSSNLVGNRLFSSAVICRQACVQQVLTYSTRYKRYKDIEINICAEGVAAMKI